MTIQNHSIALALSAFALSACGGGNDTATAPAPEDDGLFSAISSGSVARALDDGKEITAKHNAVLQIDWNTGETEVTEGDFSVRKTDEGHLAFTVNGTEHILTAADYDGIDGYRIEDEDASYYVSLYSYDGEMTEDLDPSDGAYVQVYSWYTDVEGTGIAHRGNSVVGTETEEEQLGLLTTANYGGWMNANFHRATGYEGGSTDVRVRGNMEMMADFSGSSISGSSVPGELRLRDGDAEEVFIDGVFTYDAAVIDGTTYGGTISTDADFVTNTGVGAVTGTYEGSFYGPFADETAGTFTGSGANGYGLVGQFNSDRRNN